LVFASWAKALVFSPGGFGTLEMDVEVLKPGAEGEACKKIYRGLINGLRLEEL